MARSKHDPEIGRLCALAATMDVNIDFTWTEDRVARIREEAATPEGRAALATMALIASAQRGIWPVHIEITEAHREAESRWLKVRPYRPTFHQIRACLMGLPDEEEALITITERLNHPTTHTNKEQRSA